MQLLDGQAIARQWRATIEQKVADYTKGGRPPGLAVILVGEDPASVVYTDMKERASQKIGIFSQKITLPKGAVTKDVVSAIEKLNNDPKIDGILVQLPLPEQIDTEAVLNSLDPKKDVDGLHPKNLGDLIIGKEKIIPATPKGILYLLGAYDIDTEGKHVVIVGRSNILGKPLAAMFLNRNATVTVCHSKTTNLSDLTRQADIIVMDTGVNGLLTGDMVRQGAVVIDAGIVRLPNGSIAGDVDFASVAEKTSAITPVPGGVGPMTIAALLDSTLVLADRA